jgi:hypothetical protein
MTAPTADRLTVRRRIAASAVAVFRVLTHAQGHVSIDGSGTLVAARGTDLIEAVGDVFEVEMNHQAMGGDYRIRNIVTAFEPDRALEWTPAHEGHSPIGYAYGYRLEPVDEASTDVIAYYDWAAVSPKWRERLAFPGNGADNLARSLENLDALLTDWRP